MRRPTTLAVTVWKGNKPIMIRFTPKANFGNSLVWLPEPAWGSQCGRNPDKSGKIRTAPTVCRTHGDTSDSSFHIANGLLREPVSRNWSLLARSPGADDQQDTAEPATLETPEGVVSLSVPIRFLADETERSTCWRPLCPGTLSGLADRSPVLLFFCNIKQQKRAVCN